VVRVASLPLRVAPESLRESLALHGARHLPSIARVAVFAAGPPILPATFAFGFARAFPTSRFLIAAVTLIRRRRVSSRWLPAGTVAGTRVLAPRRLARLVERAFLLAGA
jgi:hypothetical protein